MGKRLDLIGKTFGRLTVIDFDHISKDGASYWLCECNCKNRTRLIVRGYDLKCGHRTSCGCLTREQFDMTGRTFGRLTVLGLDHVTERGRTYWLCECGCENRTRIVVRRDGLISGSVLSCGCLHREIVSRNSTKHGMCDTRLHKIWTNMKQRCSNENMSGYSRYGGRGITFDPDWSDFEPFRDWALSHGYADDLSLDRIDNDLGYFPENCRWTDAMTQMNNTCRNRHFNYNGENHTIAEWSRILDVKYGTLRDRINRGDLRDFEDYFDKL